MNGLKGVPIRGFLLDINGVLYNTTKDGRGQAIRGSAEAVKRLYAESKVKFLSNESCVTPARLALRLSKLGIPVDPRNVFTPLSAAVSFLKEHKLRPHLLVHENVEEEFAEFQSSDPNCVLLGDAEDRFTFENLNSAFRVLLKHPMIIVLGFGKFYRRADGHVMDAGCYAKALQYASDARIKIIGKPCKSFFEQGLRELNMKKEEVVMVGDDILSDVGAAQAIGIRGVLVRTGKWREERKKGGWKL
ncbi:unnamed protein product [Enterobius vermicularis]|uniref:Phospholysine phosphohistidine inorganic pyrophosphate phosphatase n=1 Tax=Enterobius vermicularis TaxID=51028 RepID=A0A0N4VED5_ENTVE|nr:unnamed protein product [Enterobius vermicularis]